MLNEEKKQISNSNTRRRNLKWMFDELRNCGALKWVGKWMRWGYNEVEREATSWYMFSFRSILKFTMNYNELQWNTMNYTMNYTYIY